MMLVTATYLTYRQFLYSVKAVAYIELCIPYDTGITTAKSRKE